MRTLAVCLSVALSTWAVPEHASLQTFRISTDAVVVDVSVRDGRRPVVDLGASDFALFDNGVAQEIDSVEIAPTVIDVTAVMDVSGSASPFASWILTGIRQLQGLLTAEDGAVLVLVGRQVRGAMTPADQAWLSSPPLIGDGGTHIFDAITASAMKATEPGRRHLIVAFTDGLDTRSVIPAETRQDVLRHSNAVIEIFAVSAGGRTNASGTVWIGGPDAGRVETVGDYNYVLSSIADAAGGQFYDMRPSDSAAGRLNELISLFRQHYLLRFRPVGVKAGGWHTLKVSVKKGRYEVVARRGYERSQ